MIDKRFILFIDRKIANEPGLDVRTRTTGNVNI